jgi:hypothetical protein
VNPLQQLATHKFTQISNFPKTSKLELRKDDFLTEHKRSLMYMGAGRRTFKFPTNTFSTLKCWSVLFLKKNHATPMSLRVYRYEIRQLTAQLGPCEALQQPRWSLG